MSVASVKLCLRSWYGHPEAATVDGHYNAAKVRTPSGDDIGTPLDWTSGLRCWDLLDEEGLKLGRVYEPTETTPRWVWVDERGDRPLTPLCSMERLTVLMVEYRLMGGVFA